MTRRWAALALLFAAACAHKPMTMQEIYVDEIAGGIGASGYGSGGGGASMAPQAKMDRGPMPAPPPPPPSAAMDYAPSDAPVNGPAEPNQPAQPAAARMVHYDGWTRLRVANPRDTLEAVVAVAAGAGGRTEQMGGNTVTVRVPVAAFEAAWRDILALGDVMDRSVRADDVTEQFMAVDLRVRTLRETRKRLIELLAKSRNEEERLRLLTELTQVSEELDSFESQLRTLQELASFSRITVEAVAREAFTASGDRPVFDGFEWISGLSPFRHGVWLDDHRVALDTPDGLVMLAPKGPYVAESADGTVLWTLHVPNDPVGTGEYWIAAIQDRIADEFANPATKSLGSWSCLALDQAGEAEPYRWQICVRPDGKHLHVAQIYFPNPAQVARYAEALDQVFGGAGGGA